MADKFDKKTRSKIMTSIRSKNTRPELWLFDLLDSLGLEYKKHASLPGKPDALIEKVAIFIEGDFWHGWQFPRWISKLPLFWQKKITRNRQRDKNNHSLLRKRGFKVIRVWEHEIKNGKGEMRIRSLVRKNAYR